MEIASITLAGTPCSSMCLTAMSLYFSIYSSALFCAETDKLRVIKSRVNKCFMTFALISEYKKESASLFFSNYKQSIPNRQDQLFNSLILNHHLIKISNYCGILINLFLKNFSTPQHIIYYDDSA